MKQNRNKSSIPFVGLHAHSVSGSPFDALGYPQEHMDYAYHNGMEALALTDHGTCNGLVYQVLHTKKMRKEGKEFKPIYGVEAYFIDSIEEWRNEYEDLKKEKKKIKNEKKSATIESGMDSLKELKSSINRRSHLLLLAQNPEGLYNIFKLVSKSHSGDNFYRFPRIDYEMLKQHNKGIIVGSGCLGGLLPRCYWQHKDKEGIEFKNSVFNSMCTTVQKMQNIFGDRWYGEIQWNKVKQQHEVNEFVIQVAKEMNFKLITTIDSHYSSPELWKDRELYKRLGWLGKSNSNKPEYLSNELPKSKNDLDWELYVKNGEQTWESYKRYSKECGAHYDDDLIMESIENTVDVAYNKIEDFFPDTTVKLPSFVIPKGKTPEYALSELCIKGLKERGLDTKKEYVERLKEEIKIVRDRGFSQYFLTMKKIVDKAKEEYICGNSRGSSGGSLIAYVLDITELDPIKYGLLFSRFLRKDATDYPDIDFDISSPAEFKSKLIEEWGNDCVVPISNWNTLKLRSLIKDISKFYDVPFSEVNEVTSVMMFEATPIAKEKHGIKAGVYTPTFEEVMEYSETLKRYMEKYPHIKTHVVKLYGQIRSKSVHAGGVIIAEDLDKYIPLVQADGILQSPWTEGQNVRHLEPMGFIKFDLLGLGTLRVIEKAIFHIIKRKTGDRPTFNTIKKFYLKYLHPDKINLNDMKVYEEIYHKGNFVNTFQFTEEKAQKFCNKAKPTSLMDISAITSIQRPGALSANVDEKYLKVLKNPEEEKYEHEIIKEVLEETHGFLIYQEQLALLAHRLGKDISLDEGNELRKILTKKGIGEIEEKKERIYKKFVEGCEEKGLSQTVADDWWQKMIYFSGYSFNKCLGGDNIVRTPLGFKKIEDVIAEKDKYVLSKYGYVPIKNKYKNGKKKVYEIKTEGGNILKCTLDHKIETLGGMKKLEEIIENKYKIIVNRKKEKKIYGSWEEEIKEFKEMGFEETYDLEVDHFSHSFYANNISVSNSHSTGYGCISFQCAWLLTYYPDEWCAAYLDEESESKKEKAINSVKSFGYNIEKTNINKSKENWAIEENKTLVQSLSSIKGLGATAIEQIIKNQPFNTIEDLIFNDNILYNKLNKKGFDVLIKSQALNCLMDERFNGNLKHFRYSLLEDKLPKTQSKLDERIEEYKDIEDFSESEKIEYMTELTGMFPFEMVIKEDVQNRLQSLGVPPISEFVPYKTKACWFILREVLLKKTKKKGREYLVLNVIDINSNVTTIRCWNTTKKDMLWFYTNHPYMSRLDYNEKWGFSTRNIKKSFAMLG